MSAPSPHALTVRPGSWLQRIWTRHDWRIGTKLIVLTVPLIAALSMLAAVVEHRRIVQSLEEKLVTRAKSIAHQIGADRQYYASTIVPRIAELGGTMGADYREVHGRFPLPATYVREVSDALAQKGNGFRANLISPWPINKDKGVTDQFQRDAFDWLARHPSADQPFIRTDTLEGKRVMRVLFADLASAPSCVKCHNAHASSPKHDFKLNDVMGGLEIVMPMEQYLAESDWDLALTLAGGGVMCLLVLAIVAVGTKQTISQPLSELEGKMQAFVGARPYLGGPTGARLAGDEVAHISTAFDRMKAVIESQQQELRDANQTLEQRVTERTEQLRVTMEEKERIGSELRIASDIQKSILPRTFPPFPDRADFDLYAETIPAKEMGGDFYDFFLIDRDRLGLVIADVSGKGVPAAIFMAVSRTMLKATAMLGVDPAECLRRVNNLLCPDNESAMFVTVFYGILNTGTGELEYGNAGHNPPYLLSAQESVALLENPGGMALGVIQDSPYRAKRLRLRPGEGLFLYTDGVTEAMDAQGVLFTDARLKHLLGRILAGSPSAMVRDTVDAVRQHAAGEAQADDITLLVVRYLGQGANVVSAHAVSATFANRVEELDRLAKTVASFTAAHGLSDAMTQAFSLALDELMTNVISYAYDDTGDHAIRLRLSHSDGLMQAELEDDGKPFNPLETPPPDLTPSLEDRPIGGLGVHFVKTMMDRVTYRREGGKNILTMSKRTV